MSNEEYDQAELKAFSIVDGFLVSLRGNTRGRTIYDDRELAYTPAGIIAQKIIRDHELILLRKPEVGVKSVVDISRKGLEVIKNGKIQAYLERQEAKELQKEEAESLDLEISRNVVKDYPATKRRANAAIIIAAVAITFQLIQYFIK